MNKIIKKTVAVAFLFAIAIMAGSVIAAAGGVDIRTSKTPINPMEDPFVPPHNAPEKFPEWYQIHNPNMNANELQEMSLTTNSAVIFDGNVSLLWNESFPSGVYEVYAIQTKDLDGDKKDDVMLSVSNWNTNTYTVIAKKGSDGTDLWQESVTNGYIDAAPTDDLNGDKTEDVLITKVNRSTNTYTVIAKKGSDGTDLWQESVTNEGIYAEPTDDLDGDKIEDVLITKANWSTNTYTVIAKKGSDGTDLWQASASVTNGWISAEPTDDLDGDKTADVLIMLIKKVKWWGITYTVIAKKGSDGTDLWQESATNGSISAELTDDLDGDKTADVLITKGNWSTDTYTIIAKKGSDGTNLWQESVNGEEISAEPTDDLNGDKTADVLITKKNWRTYTNTVIAKKGSDGTNLWQESVNGEEISAEPTDDLNGDKTADVLITKENRRETGIYTVIAKKGSDGTDLWQESVINGEISAEPTDDLDGDKTADVLIKKGNWSTNTYIKTVIAKKGSDGTDLWQASVTNGEISAEPTDDLDGDKTADVLIKKGWGPSTLIAKKGSDGTDLWQESVNGEISAYPTDDLDGDKTADMLITKHNYGTYTDTIIAKKGSDGTNLWQEEPVTGWISAEPTDDLNGDKLADVLITKINWSTNTYTIIAKKGSDGTNLWQAFWQASSNSYMWAIPIGDVDRDKRENILVVASNTVYVVGVPK